MPVLDETAPIEQGSAARLVTRKIRVEVVDGPDRGVIAELTGPDARIGSGADAGLVLKDRTVSRIHLTLRVEGDAIRVVDEGSRNGTIVDGTRVREAWARPDSTIRIGDTTLCLRMLDELLELPVSPRERMGGLLGRSVAMRRIFTLLEQIAPTDARVLVEGETGTGKELVAEALHEASRRAARPMVVVDCSAVSATLIESELFGHVRGSFTGAVVDRAGAFEAADGGTVFLDEVGELSLNLQPNLLRVLERGEVRRVGSNTTRRVDVRVVAATNRALAQEVERGRFREDLYYRLTVVTVRMPPLRERPDDIPPLVRHFEALFADRVPGAAPLPDAVVAAFAARSWPGNIRELRNAVERALSLGSLLRAGGADPQAGAAAEALRVDLSEPLYTGLTRIKEAYEKAYVEAALKQAGGNITHAARIAQVDRKSIQRAMSNYKLRGEPDDT
jgi:transcriptional regulator with GAF, ATPase, and Fis domain